LDSASASSTSPLNLNEKVVVGERDGDALFAKNLIFLFVEKQLIGLQNRSHRVKYTLH
jgi:hypothetical protein